MQASITIPAQQNGKNLDGDKERTLTLYAVAPTSPSDPTPRVYVEARFWMSCRRTASTVYCSVWVRGDGPGLCISSHGAGRGGHGYHKESSALASAIQSAGITLSEGIRDTGEYAMHDALRAVAIAAGAPAEHVVIL